RQAGRARARRRRLRDQAVQPQGARRPGARDAAAHRGCRGARRRGARGGRPPPRRRADGDHRGGPPGRAHPDRVRAPAHHGAAARPGLHPRPSARRQRRARRRVLRARHRRPREEHPARDRARPAGAALRPDRLRRRLPRRGPGLMPGPRRPPWWPEGESWPPRHAPWRHHSGAGRMMRRAGCAFALLLAVLGIAGTAAVWLVASAFGIVASGTFARLVSVAALLLGLLAVLAAVAAGRRLAAPADRLVEASGRIEAGDLSVRVPVRGPAELRSLARAFNAMTSRLEETEERRRSVVAEVDHELRTPLSIIRGQAEAIADGVYPADPERMAPILDAVRGLEVLVDDLTTLGLAEAGALRLRREPVDLAVLVHDTLEAHRAAAEATGITLGADVDPELGPVEVDPGRLRGV